MMYRYNWLKTVRDGGAVKRWHAARMLQTQCNAAHSWGVAMVLVAVGVDNAYLLRYALLHDVSELVTGDVPAPVKWDNPALEAALSAVERKWEAGMAIDVIRNQLTAVDLAYLDWADMFELVQHTLEEFRLGNTFTIKGFVRRMRVLYERLALLPESDGKTIAMEMTNMLNDEVRLVR